MDSSFGESIFRPFFMIIADWNDCETSPTRPIRRLGLVSSRWTLNDAPKRHRSAIKKTFATFRKPGAEKKTTSKKRWSRHVFFSVIARKFQSTVRLHGGRNRPKWKKWRRWLVRPFRKRKSSFQQQRILVSNWVSTNFMALYWVLPSIT